MWCNPQCFLKVLLCDRCFSYYTQEPIIDGLLLYVNDLPLGISSTIRLFGNDCSLYRTITGPMDNQILQDYLNALSKWEKDWQMSFNIEKCHTVSFPTKMNIVTPYIILIVIHWIVATTIHIEASCSHRTWNGQIMLRKFPQVLSRLLALLRGILDTPPYIRFPCLRSLI